MKKSFILLLALASSLGLRASEADLVMPESLHDLSFLHWGFLVCVLGMLFGVYHFVKTKSLPVHEASINAVVKNKNIFFIVESFSFC